MSEDPTGWQRVCRLDEITAGRGRPLMLKGTEIALMRDGDDVHAIGGICPHRGGQLADGVIVDGSVICALHLWDFELRSGISAFNPADSVPVYGARVRDGQVEVDADSVPRGPGRPDVYLGPWLRRGATDRGMELVHALADGGRAPVDAMGTLRLDPDHDRGRRYPSLDDLVFIPAQLNRLPLLDDEPVDLSVTLGTRAARPLRLDLPLLVSHMSFGALSVEAKVALAAGAKAAGTAIGSGEGGMHPREKEAAGAYILEMASGYFGWTPEAVAQADAVEIKISQGAKPGQGGLLPGAKVTAEIAAVRGIAPGTPAHSPSRFPDINSPADLRRRIEQIREMNPGIPVGIKFSTGDVEADVAVAVDAGADWITVDGLGGGTGAAPVHVRDHVGLPGFLGVRRARRWLDDHGVDDVQIVATGGYRTPDEMAKILALGADAVALATASMMAIGCQQYRACHRGTCPVGIATQRQELRMRLDPEISARRLTTFLTAATTMIGDYYRLTGHRRLSELGVGDLANLHQESAGESLLG
ncbi:MAG: glutamate synthase-related protein [Gordonia sp. (in: high G+C Gram-positive bacteria)]|uniref:glutamate synthase-related protein n=1 Tax=Gordonia sp. (in: high G+C Gram-positive bacteria) TaxID=84139 RepID=UPI003C709892